MKLPLVSAWSWPCWSCDPRHALYLPFTCCPPFTCLTCSRHPLVYNLCSCLFQPSAQALLLGAVVHASEAVAPTHTQHLAVSTPNTQTPNTHPLHPSFQALLLGAVVHASEAVRLDALELAAVAFKMSDPPGGSQ